MNNKDISFQMGLLEVDIIKEFSKVHQELLSQGWIKYDKKYNGDPVVTFVDALHRSYDVSDLLANKYPTSILVLINNKNMILKDKLNKDMLFMAKKSAFGEYYNELTDALSPILHNYFNLKRELTIDYEPISAIFDKVPDQDFHF